MEEEEVIFSMPYFNEEIIQSNTVTYFVKSFSEFSQMLQEHEIYTDSKFVLAHSPKKFTSENVTIRESSKLRWKDDIPYFHICARSYTCHQGRDGNLYQKRKYAQQRGAKALTDNNTNLEHSVSMTKKLDCPAVIHVSRIIWIPEHKLQGGLTKTTEKKKMSRMIKNKMCRGEPVGEECYMFNLPDETDHMYHSVGTGTRLSDPIVKVETDRKFLFDGTDCELTVKTDTELTDPIVLDESEHKFLIVGADCELTIETDPTVMDETGQKSLIVGADGEITLETDTELTNAVVSHETDHKVHCVGSDSELTDTIDPKTGNYIDSLVEEGEKNPLLDSNDSKACILEIKVKQKETPKLRRDRSQLLKSCRSTILSIESTMPDFDEDKLEALSKNLNGLYLEITREFRTKENTRLPNEPHTPASSTKEYHSVSLGLKQEDGGRVVAADTIKSSKNLENYKACEENDIETISLKRSKKATMILIKRGKYDPQLPDYNNPEAISIPSKKSIIIRHTKLS